MRNGTGSMGMRVRWPPGSMTTSDAGSGACEGEGVGFMGRLASGAGALHWRGRGLARHFDLARAQRLTVGAVAADLGAGQQDLEAEVALDLLAQALQRLAEEFLDLAAAEADHVRVLLLEARLVVVL